MVPLMPSGPGWKVPSRFVCSMAKRSTCGVKAVPLGKWALMPVFATKPGPRTVEFGSVMFGFDSTSRCVIVDSLMFWIVRDVSGAALLAKNAPVRALAIAPSMAKTSIALLPVISGATPPSTRTPRTRPLRSRMAMIASFVADAAVARRSRVSTSAAVSVSCGWPSELLPAGMTVSRKNWLFGLPRATGSLRPTR